MDRPNECKWCKSGVRLNGQFLTFKCWTILLDHAWSQSPECKLGVAESRIQRAIDALKSANRYDTDEVDPDTWCGDQVAQAVDADYVDEAIRILEGVDNDETK